MPHRLLWTSIATRRRDLVLATLLLTGHQVGESLVPVIVGTALGRAIGPGDADSLLLWLIVLAADFALLSLSYRFGARAAMRARQHAEHRLRALVAARVVAPTGPSDLPPGELLSRASSDAGRVGIFARQLASSVASVLVLLSSTLLLLRLDLLLGAIVVLGTVVQLVAQRRAWGLLHRRSHEEQAQQARAATLAEDVVRGLRVLKGIGAEGAASARYAEASDAAGRAALRAVSSGAAVDALTTLFSGLYLTLIAGVGGWLTLHDQLSLGEFVSALGLARFVIGPMEVVSSVASSYARALASAQRIADVLAAPAAAPRPEPHVPAAASLGETGDLLVLSGVTFGTALPAHPPLTLTVADRELIGLVCDPVASTALLALLRGDTTPTAGHVALAGRELADLPLGELRRRVLVDPHDAALLPGTIAENLALVAREPELLAEATHAAFADQVLDVVPQGGRTLVGDRGESLSGGQRQRVALARALAADAELLVLPQPTSAVDSATEDGIAERVRALRAGRATLVLTTSPAWLSRCDRVVLWSTDHLVSGTHGELLAQDSGYRLAVAR